MYRFHCVKCGAVIELSEQRQIESPFPATCDQCYNSVIKEAKRNLAVWPRGWFGRCVRKSGSKGWITTGLRVQKVPDADVSVSR